MVENDRLLDEWICSTTELLRLSSTDVDSHHEAQKTASSKRLSTSSTVACSSDDGSDLGQSPCRVSEIDESNRLVSLTSDKLRVRGTQAEAESLTLANKKISELMEKVPSPELFQINNREIENALKAMGFSSDAILASAFSEDVKEEFKRILDSLEDHLTEAGTVSERYIELVLAGNMKKETKVQTQLSKINEIMNEITHKMDKDCMRLKSLDEKFESDVRKRMDESNSLPLSRGCYAGMTTLFASCSGSTGYEGYKKGLFGHAESTSTHTASSSTSSGWFHAGMHKINTTTVKVKAMTVLWGTVGLYSASAAAFVGAVLSACALRYSCNQVNRVQIMQKASDQAHQAIHMLHVLADGLSVNTKQLQKQVKCSFKSAADDGVFSRPFCKSIYEGMMGTNRLIGHLKSCIVHLDKLGMTSHNYDMRYTTGSTTESTTEPMITDVPLSSVQMSSTPQSSAFTETPRLRNSQTSEIPPEVQQTVKTIRKLTPKKIANIKNTWSSVLS
jgi:hypothetical protein